MKTERNDDVMIKFGTGGWRAVIGDEFVKENIQKVGQGVANLAKETECKTPIIIGYDRRFLSAEAARWLAEVLSANGFTVKFMNRSVPTPLVMHTVQKQGYDYGLEVTASHNPSEYNGIKLIIKEGRDASVEITNRLEELIAQVETVTAMDFKNAVEQGKIEYIKNPFNDFLDDIMGVMDLEAVRSRGPRILFDPMHGSGTYPLMVILYSARCTLDVININKDAYFGGHMPAPSKKGLVKLTEMVVNEGYDLGIAVDGDGDRLGIIDSNGVYVDANDILCMLYYYLHVYKGWRGPVVRNLATTHMLDAIAKDLGEECYEVPVGFKYISAKINETDAILGGESSGGLTVRGHINGKDSIYAATLFVEMLCKTGMSATEMMNMLREKYGNYEMVESNVRFEPAYKAVITKIVFEDKQLPDFGREIEKVSYEDGCKVYFKDGGFIICRFSGTEPLLRIFAEADTAEKSQASIDAFAKFLGL